MVIPQQLLPKSGSGSYSHQTRLEIREFQSIPREFRCEVSELKMCQTGLMGGAAAGLGLVEPVSQPALWYFLLDEFLSIAAKAQFPAAHLTNCRFRSFCFW
jgi:hypothetical protein